jgi:transcription initiation factor TFIIIB Brf1 subunit/transcription initiation factor TFIIB
LRNCIYIYRKAQQRRLTRDRTVLGIFAVVVVVVVYVAYRELGVTSPVQDIAAASNNRPKEIAQDYRFKAISKRESIAGSKCVRSNSHTLIILSAKYNV